MPISEAQNTKVVRVPNVFTEDDIAALLSFHKEWKLAFGMDAKKHGAAVTNWRTAFLHTNGLFCSMLPQLQSKMFSAAAQADHQQSWGLLT